MHGTIWCWLKSGVDTRLIGTNDSTPDLTCALQFLMPTMNPDGFAANSRANAGGWVKQELYLEYATSAICMQPVCCLQGYASCCTAPSSCPTYYKARASFLPLLFDSHTTPAYPYCCDLLCCVLVQLVLTSTATSLVPSTLPARAVSLSSVRPQPSAPLCPAHSQRHEPS
jgi:hypothetical protein